MVGRLARTYQRVLPGSGMLRGRCHVITGQRGVGKTTLMIQHLQKGFLVNGRFHFEVGGRNKGRAQIAGKKDAFLALDEIPTGSGHRIPLWLFGCLY